MPQSELARRVSPLSRLSQYAPASRLLSNWPIIGRVHPWRARLLPVALSLALLACGLPALAPATFTPPPPTTTSAPTSASAPIPSATVAATVTLPPPEHAIGVRLDGGRGEFYDRRTQQPFVVRGVNYVFVPGAGGRYEVTLLRVGLYDPARARADFARLAAAGYNTARVFIDHCGQGPGCLTRAGQDGLNPAYLDNLADLLAAARQAGLVLLLTSNDLPDGGGYAAQANSQAGDDFAGYRNAYYLTPAAVRATRRYWHDLLAGLSARHAPFEAVLGWELVNEQWMFLDQPPLSLAKGLVTTTTGTYDMSDREQKRRMVADGLIHYIAEVRAEILAQDPTALVAMGFFAPEIAAPGWYVDTASLLAGAALDFFDFHAYPGQASLAEHARLFGMQGFAAKPIVMGEYGAFRDLYPALPAAARGLVAWVAEACALGFDGWLYWAYYPANADAGDRTWSFTDEDGYLLDLLSPARQPDPCAPAAVPDPNLAFGMPVRASLAAPGAPPELAVDEDESTAWLSGSDAPQWIEVDLGGPRRIGEVRLLVAQSPAGLTTHRLRAGAPNSSQREVAHEFTGPTADGDWLVFQPPQPLENIQFLRVETIASRSWVAWKEIQVFEQASPP